MKAVSTFVRIYIHWGEFCGPVERTEIDLPLYSSGEEKEIAVFKYYVQLRGYKPFTLYKCIKTKQWLDNREIYSSISIMLSIIQKCLLISMKIKSNYNIGIFRMKGRYNLFF